MLSPNVAKRVKTLLGSATVVGLVALIVLITATAALAGIHLPGQQPSKGVDIQRIQSVPSFHQATVGTVTVHLAPTPAPVPRVSHSINWDALASCESSGNWHINTGNGYYGGLQMTQQNWNNHKPPGAPARADQASREQQIYAAEGIKREQGRGAWPPLSRPECN